LYSLPNIKVIKSRKMRRSGQVARMGKMRHAYRNSVRHLNRRENLLDLSVDG